jgi:hypothetical protein
MSKKLELKTLREDNPRDFLASLGILRLLDLMWPELSPTLSWQGAHPVITINEPLPRDWSAQITDELQTLNLDPISPLRHGDVIKTSSQNFAEAIRKSLNYEAQSKTDLKSLPALLYGAYSGQLTEEKSDFILPTKFSFSNGQGGKKLLLDVGQLIEALTPNEFAQSLSGNGEKKKAKSLRWHPDEYRAAAYRSHDPGSGITGDDHLDHPPLNILAFIGLTFYPSVPWGKSGATLGFSRRRKAWIFRWPVWSTALSVELVSSLLHCPDFMESGGSSQIARGIIRAWESRRFTDDKGNTYFMTSSPAL